MQILAQVIYPSPVNFINAIGSSISDNIGVILVVTGFIVGLSILAAFIDIRAENKRHLSGNKWDILSK